jgi:uncharacterized protein YkwD
MIQTLIATILLMAPCIDCQRLYPLTDVMPAPAPVPPMPDSAVSITMQGLIDGGTKFLGANVQKSQTNPILMEAAAKHAQYQADHRTQGHQLWDRRYRELQAKMPGLGFAEIAAESWDWQRDNTMEQLGYEMFKCWKYSSGHWSVASKQHKYWGGSMAKGRNGIWYACVIVAD